MTRLMNVSCLLVVLGCLALPAMLSADNSVLPALLPKLIVCPDGLPGVKAVGVAVGDLSPDGARRTGLTKDALDTTLRAALMASNTVTVPDKLGDAYLYLDVNLLPLDGMRSTVYSVSLRLKQRVSMTRLDGWVVYCDGTTWEKDAVGIAPDARVEEIVKNQVRDYIDQFTIDWHKANDPAQ